jgi:phage terminase small subunit
MPQLTNAKHERFAQELAKGASASEAYVLAGYSANDGNAIRLKGNEKVSSRVAEILGRAATRAEITIASATAHLLKLAEKAEALGDASGFQASRASMMDAAKLNGLVVDKSEQTHTVHEWLSTAN